MWVEIPCHDSFDCRVGQIQTEERKMDTLLKKPVTKDLIVKRPILNMGNSQFNVSKKTYAVCLKDKAYKR